MSFRLKDQKLLSLSALLQNKTKRIQTDEMSDVGWRFLFLDLL